MFWRRLTNRSMEAQAVVNPAPVERELLVVNGIRMDKFLAAPLVVHEPIPPEERPEYLLRGVNMGRLALNLMQSKNRINPYDDLFMHVGDSHDTARHIAEAATWVPASSPANSQFDEEGVQDFHDLTGERRDVFPGLVLGLPREYGDRLVNHPPNFAMVIQETVPFSQIDPHSQELLGNLFEIDLSQY